MGDKDGILSPQYSFSPIVLQLVRSLVPQDISGRLWPDACKLSLEEFCVEFFSNALVLFLTFPAGVFF